MVELADIAKRGAAILVLAHMGRRKAITMQELVKASQLTFGTAKSVRDELIALGLIEMRTVGERGGMKVYEISLTPLGEIVGEALADLDDSIRAATEDAPERRKTADETRRDVRAVGDRWRAKKE